MKKSATQTRINSLTVSRTVQEWLCEGPLSGRVLAVFEHACDLLIPDERVVALVTPRVGAGPLNVVVKNPAASPARAQARLDTAQAGGGSSREKARARLAHRPLGHYGFFHVKSSSGLFRSIAPGMPAALGTSEIQVDGLTVCLDEAAVWEPRPGWGGLRPHQSVILDHLPDLHAVCLERVPTESLFVLLKPSSAGTVSPGGTLAAVRRALDALRAGWIGSPIRLCEGVEQMAGLGSGLTPSGDDFLAGVMLWAWLAHPTPADFCCAVAETAASRTTTLSAAFLRAAARGECNIAWHSLLEAASQGAEAKVAQAAEGLLTHGATSGADALAGFLWAASLPTPAPVALERPSPPKAVGR